ncbi:MAG: LamG domain-containing protein, partial [Myxococcota bacterium]
MAIESPGVPASIAHRGFSVSAWVAPHAFEWGDGEQYSAVVSQFDRKTQRGFVFGLFRHGTWGLRLGFGDHTHNFRTTNQRLPVDTWSHIAASYEPKKKRVTLYLNGELIADKAVPSDAALVPATGRLRIGKHSQPYAIAGIMHFNTFHGLLDEVRISAGATKNSDVRSQYT